jgi:N-acetylmuramoyl-L-alanine amidase
MALYEQDFLVMNKFSRPGFKLAGVRGLVMHWTADPGATDENEVNYFDGSDGGGGRYASAHFFVDSDSAKQDIPLDEVAYHANEQPCRIAKLQGSIKIGNTTYVGGANVTAIGIEMCEEKDGSIHPKTVERAANIAAELCKKFNLNPLVDIYRHYDVTGKNCPAPWVSDASKFDAFKRRVNEILKPPVTPASKPVVKQIGVVTVTADFLNVRKGPDASYPIAQPPIKKGQQFKAYDLKMGWYNIGSGWVSKKYVTFQEV